MIMNFSEKRGKQLKNGNDQYFFLYGLIIIVFITLCCSGLNASQEFPVPPPPFTPGIYPCSECHEDIEPNATRRTLEDEHTNIRLKHAEYVRWCLDCHDVKDRDKLHLQSGEKIDFEDSYRLCGQCHGTLYRDWQNGVHGKRTGYWNGRKEYLLCVHCHNPHDPKFKPLKPKPPPSRPAKPHDILKMKEKQGGHGHED